MGYISPVKVQEFLLVFRILRIVINIQLMKGQSYGIADIENLYSQLCNQKGNPNIVTFKQQLASISRILVWDDQHNSDLFDFLCEVKMLQTLFQIFGSTRDKEVVNAILSFLTILLSNLTREPSLNYLLSHAVIGCLTLAKFGNMNSQIADYYINFLKVLSRKITTHNLHLFFNQRYPTFPILSQTIRFFNHPESLVRTTCRNIILTFAKLKSSMVNEFMSNFPFATYFVHQSNFLKEYWAISDGIIREKEDKSYELAHLQQLFQDHEEILIFLDDLLNLEQPGVAQCFVSAFLNECLSPLIHSLDMDAKDCFSIQICLYILIVLFKTFSHPFIADCLALIFFGKYHTKQLALSLYEPVPCLLSYDKKWKFKGFWDSHQEKIRLYCSSVYNKLNDPLLKTGKSQKAEGVESLANRLDTNAVFGVTNNFYERQIQKVENIFGFSILSKSGQKKRFSSGEHIKQTLEAIPKKGLKLQQCQINAISGTIESYLMSKDDTLVLLALTLFSAVYQNRSISPEVMNYCRLSLQPKDKDFESVIRVEKIIINSLKIFSVDPPCFRMCTYVQASEMVKRLSSFYDQNGLKLSLDIISALKLGMKLSIDRITPYLYSGKQWQKVISMYLQVSKNYSKKRFKTLKSFGFLPADEMATSHLSLATEYIFENYPKEFHHQIARDFWIYFLIKDLFLNFNEIYSLMKLQFGSERKEACKYEEGKSLSAIDDEIVSVQYRMKASDKYVPCSAILMTGYLVLVEHSVIQKKINYDQFLPLIDRSDPRRLFLTGEGETIWLQLNNASTAQALLLHLQEGRSVIMRYKLSQIVKQVQVYRGQCS